MGRNKAPAKMPEAQAAAATATSFINFSPFRDIGMAWPGVAPMTPCPAITASGPLWRCLVRSNTKWPLLKIIYTLWFVWWWPCMHNGSEGPICKQSREHGRVSPLTAGHNSAQGALSSDQNVTWLASLLL